MKAFSAADFALINSSGGLRGKILFGYALLIPIIVILRQYFNFTWAGEISKVFAAFFVLMCLPIAAPRLIEKGGKPLFLFVLLVVYPIAITLVWIYRSSLDPAAMFAHFFGGLLFWICLSAGTQRDAIGFLQLSQKCGWYNLGWNTALLLFYRVNPLGFGGYEGFDSSGLIPSFAAAAIFGATSLVLLHLIVMFFAGKRIIFFACVAAWLAFLFFRRFSRRARIVVATVVALIGVGIFLLIGSYTAELQERFGNVRAVAFIFTFLDGDFSADSSFDEKISEVVSSYSQVVSGSVDLVLGNGIGWRYRFVDWGGSGDAGQDRYYLHFSPFFIVLIWGFLGLAAYLGVWWVAFKSILRGEIITAFCGIYLLIELLVGLTRLNLFTEPGIAFVLGAAMASIFGINLVSNRKLSPDFRLMTEKEF